MNITEEMTQKVLSKLCDKCLAIYEADPHAPLADICKPCQDRLINMCYETLDEVERDLEKLNDALERAKNYTK